MKTQIIVRWFLISVVLASAPVSALWRRAVGHVRWEGVGVYIAVDREKVQDKLDEYLENNPGAPPLYVLGHPVVRGIGEDKHLVYIDFGFTASPDFARERPDEFRGPGSVIIIPLLSTSPDEGPPEYDLALAQMFPADRGDMPNPYLLYPSRQVDSIHVAEDGASIWDGNEGISISYDLSEPCQEPSPVVRAEFDDAVFCVSQLGFSAPDLGLCDRHQGIAASNRFCSRLRRILPSVQRSLPNVCASYAASDKGACRVNVTTLSISPGFRETLLVDPDGPINIVAAEWFFGNITSGLRYPCVCEKPMCSRNPRARFTGR